MPEGRGAELRVVPLMQRELAPEVADDHRGHGEPRPGMPGPEPEPLPGAGLDGPEAGTAQIAVPIGEPLPQPAGERKGVHDGEPPTALK